MGKAAFMPKLGMKLFTLPRASSRAVRSPRDSMAALIAPTRSSSTVLGSRAAIIRPSDEMMAEASMSAEVPFKSLRTVWSMFERIVQYLEMWVRVV